MRSIIRAAEELVVPIALQAGAVNRILSAQAAVNRG